MANTYTAITKKAGKWWVGWIEEIPGVNCQERTRKALLESLRATLREALELNRSEAVSAAESEFTEEEVCV
jgi:predicted RNase H-like HicB family nuclease